MIPLAFIPLVDAAVLPLLTILAWRRIGGAPARVWSLLLLPLVVFAVLAWVDGDDRGRLGLLLLLAWGAWLLRWPRASLQGASALGLILVSLALLLEFSVARTTFWDARMWHQMEPTRLLAALQPTANLPASVEGRVTRHVRMFSLDDEVAWPVTAIVEARARGEGVELRISGGRSYTWNDTWSLPADSWSQREWRYDAPARGTWLWALEVPADAQVALRSAIFVDANGVPLRPVAMPSRLKLWYGNPNTVGHAVAAIAALAMALSPRFIPALLYWGIGLLAVIPTGSRTAALALAVGGAWLLASFVRPRWRLPLSGLAFAAVAYAVDRWGDALGRMGDWAWEDQGIQARLELMQIAWSTMLEHPVTGAALEMGAHNFWLDYAGTLGVPGLLAALWLTGGMLYLAWRVRSARAFGVVLTALTLQLSESTLPHFAVMMPVMLAIQAFAPPGTPLTPQLASGTPPPGARRQGTTAPTARSPQRDLHGSR
jgi:hypothetical protein